MENQDVSSANNLALIEITSERLFMEIKISNGLRMES